MMNRHPSWQTALLLEVWPRADRDAWRAATEIGESVLRSGGAASHLAPVTIHDLTRRYGYFLNHVRLTEQKLNENVQAAAVTPETILTYLAATEGRLAPVTIANSLHKIHRVAGLIAPNRDWTWLRRISRRLETRARPADKRSRVVEAAELFTLGLHLMGQADKSTRLPLFTRALLYRDGLIIALLTATLLRRANLASLTIGETIVNTGSGWLIAIPASESKSGRPIEMRLPGELSSKIDRYLEHYRPTFRGHETHGALWLSRNGRPLSASQLYLNIINRTRAAFGRAINPHLVRDCAVTSIALHDSANIQIASAALGHRHPRTTEKYYNQSAMIDAVRSYQAYILGSPEGEKS